MLITLLGATDVETNSRLYKLLSKFYEITNCPVLINTSFNVRGG